MIQKPQLGSSYCKKLLPCGSKERPERRRGTQRTNFDGGTFAQQVRFAFSLLWFPTCI